MLPPDQFIPAAPGTIFLTFVFSHPSKLATVK